MSFHGKQEPVDPMTVKQILNERFGFSKEEQAEAIEQFGYDVEKGRKEEDGWFAQAPNSLPQAPNSLPNEEEEFPYP